MKRGRSSRAHDQVQIIGDLNAADKQECSPAVVFRFEKRRDADQMSVFGGGYDAPAMDFRCSTFATTPTRHSWRENGVCRTSGGFCKGIPCRGRNFGKTFMQCVFHVVPMMGCVAQILPV